MCFSVYDAPSQQSVDCVFFSLQGTSAEQDNRFSNKQKKLLKQLKFAECLDKKVQDHPRLCLYVVTKC